MKITISLPSRVDTRKTAPTLVERIDYAIDCIACNVNKKEAIVFLQEVKARMDGAPRQTREFQDLLNKVNVALADYGHYHLVKPE
jgi:hypothetical protein